MEAWRVQQGWGKACRLETQKELQLEFKGTPVRSGRADVAGGGPRQTVPLACGGKSLSSVSRTSADGIRHPHYGNQPDLL